MPEKGDQFYGYVAQWEGYPWQAEDTIPINYGAIITTGEHPAHATTIHIKQTTGQVAAGDALILDNYAYIIVEYDPDYVVIEPGLYDDVPDNTIGSVLHSAVAPTTFKIINDEEPLVKLIALSAGTYGIGDTEIKITATDGIPEVDQQLLIGSEYPSIRYLITAVVEDLVPGDYFITISGGLEFPLLPGVYVTQTRMQWLDIKERDGEIFENDVVKLLNFYYQIISFREETTDPPAPEAIRITNPGLSESIPADTFGRIYH
jgi:hypothetical protein